MFWRRVQTGGENRNKKRITGSGPGKKITLFEWIKLFYAARMDEGYTINEIDEMDVFRYLDVIAYKQEKEYWKNVEEALAFL